MKIEKIDIQTSNKKYATDIAMLVDKPEFLQEIEKLRKKWRVTKFYEPSSFEVFLGVNVIAGKHKQRDKRLSEFNQDINNILKKFNRDRSYKKVIEYALFCGIVPEKIYRSCYFDIVPIGEQENMDTPESYQYVIVMSLRAELGEVKKAYEEFKEHVKDKIKFHSRTDLNVDVPGDIDTIKHFYRGNIYPSADIDKFRTLNELKRNREFYWISYEDYLNGISKRPLYSSEVLVKWGKKCPINGDLKLKDKNRVDCSCKYCTLFDVNTIEKAIPAYIKFLEQS